MCELWCFGSSTVWVALFHGENQTGRKTVRTLRESRKKVINKDKP
nr:MAG TPA: hypothetical protein [Caudoviricetes sp.]